MQHKNKGSKKDVFVLENRPLIPNYLPGKMIVKDMMPLSIVEGAGFLEFTQRLDPRYKPPRWVL